MTSIRSSGPSHDQVDSPELPFAGTGAKFRAAWRRPVYSPALALEADSFEQVDDDGR